MAQPDPAEVDPVARARFQIYKNEKIASVGSCFAQHLGRSITGRGFSYLVTEEGDPNRQFGVYPARFGNLYTARQLLQLFQRAYGLFEPANDFWVRPDGRLVDAFRPQVETAGFANLETAKADRNGHLLAVRQMFETMDVLVFTLGLTEAWLSEGDGAVFPLAPGVVAQSEHPLPCHPHNFSVREIFDDLAAVITKARLLRPRLKILLTVSPVPLIATITDNHVLSATTYSKSVLRVAAEETVRSFEGVDYFPSFEVITGQHNGHRHLAEDLRSVRAEGVAEVMRIFDRHYLCDGEGLQMSANQGLEGSQVEELAAVGDVICDEEAIAR